MRWVNDFWSSFLSNKIGVSIVAFLSNKPGKRYEALSDFSRYVLSLLDDFPKGEYVIYMPTFIDYDTKLDSLATTIRIMLKGLKISENEEKYSRLLAQYGFALYIQALREHLGGEVWVWRKLGFYHMLVPRGSIPEWVMRDLSVFLRQHTLEGEFEHLVFPSRESIDVALSTYFPVSYRDDLEVDPVVLEVVKGESEVPGYSDRQQ